MLEGLSVLLLGSAMPWLCLEAVGVYSSLMQLPVCHRRHIEYF